MMEDILRDSRDFFKDSLNSTKTPSSVESTVCSVPNVGRIDKRCNALTEGIRLTFRLTSLTGTVATGHQLVATIV